MTRRFAMAGLLLAAVWAGTGCDWRANPAPFLDDQGRIVVYHGVNVCNASKHAPGRMPWHTREDFARLPEWGFNLVRFLVFWEAVEPEPGQYDEAYIADVLERVGWLEELDVAVLLDFHQDLYAQQFGGNGFPAWTVDDGGHAFTRREPWNLNYFEPAVMHCYDHFWRSEALKQAYVDMVRFFLERVDGCPNVIGLEIMNEPWPHMGVGFEPRILTDFYADLQAMHRSAGFTTPLFFEPVIYTSAGVPSRLRFNPDPGFAYAVHYYDPLCHEGGPYTRFGEALLAAAVERKCFEARRFGAPLIYTEFGVTPGVEGFGAYLEDFLAAMDARGLSWCYWAYDRANQNGFGIVDGEGREQPQMDYLVQLYPQRIAGREAAWRRGPGWFELAYDPVDADGPTVVFVPPDYEVTAVTRNGVALSLPEGSRLELGPPEDLAQRQRIRIEWLS